MNHLLSQKTVQKTLPNGLTLVAVPFKGIKTASIHAWVKVGSCHESPSNNGICHFLEHMIFRGNKNLGNSQELALKMEELGGEMNAATSFDHTEYWLDFHIKFLETAIVRFSDFMQFPAFENLETEREIILEEAKNDYNEEDLLIDVDSLSAQKIWPDSSMGLPIIGTPETLESIKKEDLQSWFQLHYQPQNMIVGVSGDFNVEGLFQKLESAFGGLVSGSTLPLPEIDLSHLKPQVCFQPNKDNQYQFQWGIPITNLDPKKKIQLQILSRMLDDGTSSRLQHLVREEQGLVYDISSSFFYFKGGGLFQIQGTVSTEKAAKLAGSLQGLFQEIAEKGFREEEFNLAQLRQQTALDCFQDNAEGILQEEVGFLMNPYSLGLQETLEYLDQLKLEDLQSVTQEVLAPHPSLWVMVGPEDENLKKHYEKTFHAWL